MAAESRDKSYFKTPPGDSTVTNLSFSIDSLQLGDSTRSLLSPLYDCGAIKNKSFDLENGVFSEDEKIVEKSTRSNSSSEDDISRTVTVKQADRNGSTHSKSSNGSSFSYTSPNSTYSTPRKSQKLKTEAGLDDTELSAWEQWLLSKVIKDHEKAKGKIKKNKLDKEISKKEIAETLEKEQKAELNRQEWLQLKSREERIKNELIRRGEREKGEKVQEEKDKIEEKSAESYRNWSEVKENERQERIEVKRKEKWDKREEENSRQQRSQEAYEKWLEKAKRHPKSTNTHFGYLSGKVTGYYDWTCYPMPTYNNPNPWVAPKLKKKYLGKIQHQNPSPPLLFKELEQREQNTKQKNSKLKMKKGIC